MSIQKIDGSGLETYKIIIILFQMDGKDGKFCFFEIFFLLADISINVAFRMLLLILNNIKVNFNDWELE